MTEIVLIRHGESKGNVNGLVHGHSDPPLTRNGIQQAKRVASRIKQLESFDGLLSSPLDRARSTASQIATVVDQDIVLDDRLKELNFGDLEGLRFEDLIHRYPELYLSIIDPDGTDFRFPNGESRRQLYERVAEVACQALEKHRGGRLIIVAHLIVIGSLIASVTSGDPADVVKYLVRNGSLSHLSVSRSGSVTIHALDDVRHLE